MKAIISKSNVFVGTTDRFITNEYKRLSSILKIAQNFAKKINHSVRIELYYNWDNRYSDPNKTIIIEN